MISKQILSIIICPLCKGRLEERKDNLFCPVCNKAYSIVNDVPYLLDGQYIIDKCGVSRSFEFKNKFRNSRFFKILKYIFGADFIPYDPLKKYHNIFFSEGGKDKIILNLGSGSLKYPEGVINVDIEHFPNVNIVADGCCLPFASETFDSVISEAVLEHVKYPDRFIAEIKRVLKKDGAAFVVVPFIHPFHGYPSDFQRYSLFGLKVLFEDFEEIESGVYRGPSVALVNFVSDYMAGLFFLKSSSLHILIKSIFTVMIFPLKFLDIILNKKKNSYILAHCVYYIGKKR